MSDTAYGEKFPTKQGRPLLLGQALDESVQDYVTSMRTVGGVVNTAIVMAAAEGITAARVYLYSMVVILRSRNHGLNLF